MAVSRHEGLDATGGPAVRQQAVQPSGPAYRKPQLLVIGRAINLLQSALPGGKADKKKRKDSFP